MGIHTLIIILILLLTFGTRSVRLKIMKEPATLSMIFLAFWSFITIVAMLRFAPASAITNSVITWLRWVQFMPILYLIVYGVGAEAEFKKIINILIIIALFISIWAIYEIFFPSEFASTYYRGAVTFTKPLFREHNLSEIVDSETGFYIGSANYNIAGTFSAMAALIAIPFLFKNFGQPAKNKIQLYAFFATIILIAGIIATQSRSSLICFIVGLLVLSGSVSLKRNFLTILAFGLIGAIVVIFFSDYGFIQMILETIVNLPNALSVILVVQDYSPDLGFSINVYGAAKRALTILEAFKAFIDSPFLGVGFFGFSYRSPQFGTAENFYFQMLAETGALGFVLLIIFLLSVWRYTKMDFMIGTFAYKYQIGFRGAYVGAIISNLTGTLFYDQRIWGLFLVLSAIQIRLARDEILRIKNYRKEANYGHLL